MAAFPLVICSCIFVSFKLLLRSSASLSWMDVNFLKPESIYTVMAWRFPIWYFLSAALSVYRCIFLSGPFSSHKILFSHYLSIWLFYYVLPFAIFYFRIILPHMHPVVGISSVFIILCFSLASGLLSFSIYRLGSLMRSSSYSSLFLIYF